MVSVSRRSEGFSSFHMACTLCGRLTASHRAITTPCVTLSALVTRLSADRADTITTIMKETAAKSATIQLTTLSPARDSVTIVFSNRGCCCIEVVRPGYFPERNLQTIKSRAVYANLRGFYILHDSDGSCTAHTKLENRIICSSSMVDFTLLAF